MRFSRQIRRLSSVVAFFGAVIPQLTPPVLAQDALTWEQVRERFHNANPNLRATRVGIDETKASEITAYLKPNPEV